MDQVVLRVGSAARADQVTLSLCGELDVSSAPSLMARLHKRCRLIRHMDVDLRWLASTPVGLSIFVTAHFQCLGADIVLRFLNPSPFVRELLASTGLEEVLSVTTTGDFVGA